MKSNMADVRSPTNLRGVGRLKSVVVLAVHNLIMQNQHVTYRKIEVAWVMIWLVYTILYLNNHL